MVNVDYFQKKKMEAKTKIILNRPSDWIYRMRPYRVFINDKEVSKIKNGAVEEFPVEAGSATVQCKVDWYSSRPLTVDLKEGEIAYLRVRSGMKLYWPFLIAVAIGAFLIFFYRKRPDRPDWAIPVALVLVIPGLLYSLYYMTLGRKDTLVVEKDAKNVFA